MVTAVLLLLALVVTTAVGAAGYSTSFDADEDVWNYGPNTRGTYSGRTALYGSDSDESTLTVTHAGGTFTYTVVSRNNYTAYPRIFLDDGGSPICDSTSDIATFDTVWDEFTKSCADVPAGDYLLTVRFVAGTSGIDSLETSGTVTPPPPPPTPTPGLTPTIPLTYTCYINASNPSQGANLIQNGSFEESNDGGFTPDNWYSNPGIAIANAYWKEIPAQAADGEDYLLHRLEPSASFYQVVEVLTDTQVLVGTAFRSPVGPGSATMSFTPPVTGSLYMTSSNGGDWQLHEFTTTLAAGNYTLNLNAPDTTVNGESAAFDLVYMFPVTGAGVSVWCPFFNTIETPTPPPSGTGSIIGYPGWMGSGAYCTTCPLPSSLIQIGAWVGWLGCILTNLFFCWLETWMANLYNAIGASLAWLAYAWNSLVTIIEALWNQAMVVWGFLASYIEGIWGWFTTFMTWLVAIMETVVNWWLGVLGNLWNTYIPGLTQSFFNGVVWATNAAISAVGWVWSIVLVVAAWLVDRFWDLVSYIDPLALLIWFLKLPFIQSILSVLSYFGIGNEAARVVLYALATVMRDIYDALLELWDLLIIVVQAFRGSWGDEPYKIFLNVNGEDIDVVAPAELYATGANATKILWLGLAAVASVDYAVEIFPLELPLWLAIGGLAFVVVMWTLNLWKEVLPFG